jgi:hypothetical protein
VAHVDLLEAGRDRADQPGSVSQRRVSAEGVAIDLAQLARPHLLDAGDAVGEGRVDDDGWCSRLVPRGYRAVPDGTRKVPGTDSMQIREF